MTTRLATMEDVDVVVSMGLSFLDATPYGASQPATAESLGAFVRNLLTSATAAVFVAEGARGVVGMIAAWLFPHPFSGAVVASELVWWVNPDERGTAGMRLLRDIEAWARERGATAIQMIAPVGSDIGKVYAHRGYTPVETLYQRGL